MNRRQFLSITALPLLATTGFKAKAHIVALPFHLTKKDSLRNQFLSASQQLDSFGNKIEPIFYYFRPAEFGLVRQAFDIGLVREIWTTPPMLTLLDRKFGFTGALGVNGMHLEKLSFGLRKLLSQDISLSYFSLPQTNFYFAQTSNEPPQSVHCFYPFRQILFGKVENSESAILDCLPLSVIKSRPELREAKLHLDTFSHPLHLGLVIRNDHKRLEQTRTVAPVDFAPRVPKFLTQVYEKFQANSASLVEDFWRNHAEGIPLVQG